MVTKFILMLKIENNLTLMKTYKNIFERLHTYIFNTIISVNLIFGVSA